MKIDINVSGFKPACSSNPCGPGKPEPAKPSDPCKDTCKPNRSLAIGIGFVPLGAFAFGGLGLGLGKIF
ncbi:MULTISPECIES: hypothetical protein [Pseudomonas]|uniref:Uncharacterized protein n=1 Tax=Pseudomonas trivialis TaxID=200450 RepID=A0A0H5A8V2_9PSED|nr:MULTISPECIES: hypothetical protein [Pseudomonas]AKS06020.1 hypothetical protein AA957_07850 [Pseudomonas trivialis]CRM00343.1 hypothetical protein [Pseudomonas sp. 24 R 17]CRM37828.1 hypothetical protein [Pseudomonas sp. 35 E 8]